MSVKYIVSYKTGNFNYYSRMCGINTYRRVSTFAGFKTVKREFNSLEDAQAFIDKETSERNRDRVRIPVGPQYGAESNQMRFRDLRKDEFKITVEGV